MFFHTQIKECGEANLRHFRKYDRMTPLPFFQEDFALLILSMLTVFRTFCIANMPEQKIYVNT